MTKIKLNDRVKHVDGRIGTVVYDDGERFRPMWIAWEGERIDGYNRDEAFVAEVIGHRYFVDTPFTIGETYATEGRIDDVTVVGVGLLCRSGYGLNLYHHPDGKHVANDFYNLRLPTPKPETKPYTIELTDDQIEKVRAMIGEDS